MVKRDGRKSLRTRFKKLSPLNRIVFWIALLSFLLTIIMFVRSCKDDPAQKSDIDSLQNVIETSSSENHNSAVDTDALCKLLESSLDKWIANFDNDFKNEYDSLRGFLSYKVGLESGVVIPAQLDFCIKKRAEKDAEIDARLIEATKEGCNIVINKKQRRLPINVRKINNHNGKDLGPHYEGVYLDTL